MPVQPFVCLQLASLCHCLPICLSICLSVYITACLFSPCLCRSFSVSASFSVYLYLSPSVCPIKSEIVLPTDIRPRKSFMDDPFEKGSSIKIASNSQLLRVVLSCVFKGASITEGIQDTLNNSLAVSINILEYAGVFRTSGTRSP